MPIPVEDITTGTADFIQRYWPAATAAAAKYAPVAKNTASGVGKDLATVGLGAVGLSGLLLAATPPAPKAASNPLLKTASARWVKELGGLSDEAVELLKKRGVPRSWDQIVAGMDEGTDNILAQSNAAFDHSSPAVKSLSGGGYLTETQFPAALSGGDQSKSVIHTMDPDNPLQRFVSPLHSAFSGTESRSLRDALGKRHEAYEAAAAHKGHVMQGVIARRQNKKVRDGASFIAKKLKSPKAARVAGAINDSVTPVGVHNSLNVLGREANDVQRLDRVYPGVSKFTKVRNSTGESDLLERFTGKQYGKDQFSSKDLSKLTNAKGTPVRMGVLGNIKGTRFEV